MNQIEALKRKNAGLRAKNEELLLALKRRNINFQNLSRRYDFLVKRIKQVFGNEGYMKIMNTIETPGGFDSVNFKKVNDI